MFVSQTTMEVILILMITKNSLPAIDFVDESSKIAFYNICEDENRFSNVL